MKEDVLQDLPPKITQDYYCDLSPLQEALYEDFSRSPAHETLTETLKGPTAAANTMQGNTHVFQVLIPSFLRLVALKLSVKFCLIRFSFSGASLPSEGVQPSKASADSNAPGIQSGYGSTTSGWDVLGGHTARCQTASTQVRVCFSVELVIG